MTGPDVSPHKRIRVLVETAERAMIGYIYKPERGESFRLSDHLNTYDKVFLNLADVEIKDRGQVHRPGEKRKFIAVAIQAITFITPLDDE